MRFTLRGCGLHGVPFGTGGRSTKRRYRHVHFGGLFCPFHACFAVHEKGRHGDGDKSNGPEVYCGACAIVVQWTGDFASFVCLTWRSGACKYAETTAYDIRAERIAPCLLRTRSFADGHHRSLLRGRSTCTGCELLGTFCGVCYVFRGCDVLCWFIGGLAIYSGGAHGVCMLARQIFTSSE